MKKEDLEKEFLYIYLKMVVLLEWLYHHFLVWWRYFKTKSVEDFKININGLQTMMTNSIVLTIFKVISKEYAIPIFFGTNSPIIRWNKIKLL